MISTALDSVRVVNLVGPRQVGKTTLVRDLLGIGQYITLDDPGILDAVKLDDVGQLESLMGESDGGPLIIDEVQAHKDIAIAIKLIVDRNPRKGQFILTGSSNIFTLSDVADTLVGRVQTIKLWPLSVSEISQSTTPHLLDWAVHDAPSVADLDPPEVISRDRYIQLILEGGYPEARLLAERSRQTLYRDYVDSIVDRDIKQLFRIRNTRNLRRLIDQLAIRTGEELNVAAISNMLGMRRETTEDYLIALERLALVTRLPAWTPSEAKRDIKHAKIHFVDSGMAAALCRKPMSEFSLGRSGANFLGPLLETFVFNELLRMLPYQQQDFRLYHWRNSDHGEIDILADAGRSLVGFEVKASTIVREDDFKHLRWFASNGPGKRRTVTGIVFYFGEHQLHFGDRMFALPVSCLWA